MNSGVPKSEAHTTPLHEAAFNGHIDMVESLIKAGSEVDASNENGLTSLHVASANGHLDVVKCLIRHRAKVRESNKEGFTSLHLASQNGHLKIVQYLVSLGAEIAKRVNNGEDRGRTPLWLAAQSGHLGVVTYLISKGAQTETCDGIGFTPLHAASKMGHLDVVEVLVSHGAQIEQVADGGKTPLHLACIDGRFDVVWYFVRNRAPVDMADSKGSTPLHEACKYGFNSIVQCLCTYGAPVDKTNDQGQTPLHMASMCGHLDTVEHLLSNGAQNEPTDKHGLTPLHYAATEGYLDVVQFFISKRATVDMIDNEGSTPLFCASRNGHLDIVKFLIDHGAEIGKRNNDGRTPLHVASGKGHRNVVVYLQSKQAAQEGPKTEAEAGDEQRDARLSFQPEVELGQIFVKDLTVEYMEGGNLVESAFHKKKAREHKDCYLGGGSFGKVSKAKHPRHGEVAVKVAKLGEEDQVMMYQKEAGKHGRALTCPYIVAIKGFVQCDDDACHCGLIGIVMEFMQCGSLWDFRTREWEDRPDLWPLTNRMVYDISSGMHFLHDDKIIHRDLKLENVLLDHYLNAKIADLGLATHLQTSSGDKCWGTNSHKPPEAFRTDLPSSTKVVTPKYDVYSFAMTLYELLTGIHPYAERGFDMMRLLKVDLKQAPCLQLVPPSTPEDLKQIMIDSWSYEPDHRPEFKDIKERVKKLGIEPTFELLGYFVEKSKASKKGGNSPPHV